MQKIVDIIFSQLNALLTSQKSKIHQSCLKKIRKVTLEFKIKEDNFTERNCFFAIFTNNYFEDMNENQSFWDLLKFKNANNQTIYINHDIYENDYEKYVIFTLIPTIPFYSQNRIIFKCLEGLKTKVQRQICFHLKLIQSFLVR